MHNCHNISRKNMHLHLDIRRKNMHSICMLQRKAYDQLLAWKNKSRKMALLVNGARQVG
jgi:hypothetical protein